MDDFLFLGGFPELHAGRVERDFWYAAYVATYLERDVRNILNVSDLGDFDRLLRAAALRTSQILSFTDLARWEQFFHKLLIVIPNQRNGSLPLLLTWLGRQIPLWGRVHQCAV